MPADIRKLAQEAVELAGKATPGDYRVGWEFEGIRSPWSAQVPDGSTIVTAPAPPFALGQSVAAFVDRNDACLFAHAGTHYATLARALIEALDSSRSWDDAHNDACKELDRALADRDAALRNLRVTSEALSEVAQDRDKLLVALPHALGSCKCERQEWDETRQLPPWPEEHEAAREWLRGRIE